MRTIKRFAGRAPKPVQLTIDPAIQRAAEAALAGVTQNAALVAIEPATGAIRAVVSKPDGGFDRALAGTYPPGSTFKVVTSAALLARGPQRRDAGAVPGRRHRRRADVQELRGRGVGRARSRDRVRGVVQQRVHRSRRQAPRRTRWPGAADVVRVQHALVARRRRGRRFVPEAERPRRSRGVGDRSGTRAREPAADGVGRGRGRERSLAARRCSSPQPAPTAGPGRCPRSTPVVDCDAAVVHGERRPARRHRRGRGPAARLVRQDRHRRVRQRQPAPTHAWFIGFRGNLAYAVIVEDGGVGGRVAAPLAAGFLAACRSESRASGPVSWPDARGRGSTFVGRRDRSRSLLVVAAACGSSRQQQRRRPRRVDVDDDEAAPPRRPRRSRSPSRTTRRSRSTSAARRASRRPNSTGPRRCCGQTIVDLPQVRDAGARRWPPATARSATRLTGDEHYVKWSRRRRRSHPRPDSSRVARLREPQRHAADRGRDVHASVRQSLHRRARRRRRAHAVARARRPLPHRRPDPEDRSPGSSRSTANASPGTSKAGAMPMLHVWVVPNPCGPFARSKASAPARCRPDRPGCATPRTASTATSRRRRPTLSGRSARARAGAGPSSRASRGRTRGRRTAWSR